MQDNIQILSTRELDEEMISSSRRRRIHIDVSPFIRIEPVESVEVQQEVESAFMMDTSVVFTSSNAVEAVYGFLSDAQPIWNVYCIGQSTADRVLDYFPFVHLAGTADNAADLADLIMEECADSEIIFFCGDRRRDELPDKLRDADFDVNELVVYQTLLLPHKVKKHYDGIMFYSPSGVESFFSMNRLPPGTPLFAIGNTTATAIRNRCGNPVIVSGQPSREELVGKVIEYFS